MSAVCTINHLDHVGVAVKDIESALAFFSNVFDVPDANVVLMDFFHTYLFKVYITKVFYWMIQFQKKCY